MKPTFDYSSVFKIGSHGLVSLVVSGFISSVALAAPASNALPTGGAVVSGNVAIATNAATMNINQASSKSVINWQTYNIGSAATVNYNFAQAGSSSLNRVLSNNPSEIYGRLNANGKVILVNPNGIVFGSGSSVNVGSLVATTMNIKDADYLNDKLVFTRDGSIGKVLNEGTITAEDKGYIALLAPEVVNKGVIKAVMGSVSMAAGEKIELTLDNSGLKTVILEPSTVKTLIDNKALIEAKGGVVYLGAKEANAILDTVMNLKNSGIVEATAMNNTNGKIILDGDNIEVDGTLKATEVYAGNKNNAKTLVKATATLEGEFVETSGKQFALEKGASIKARHWLIDPVNITIDSTLAGTIATALGSGDVTVTTAGGNTPDTSSGESGTDGDITVDSAITWATAQKLTLSAHRNIYINADVTIENDGGELALHYGQGAVYTNNSSDYILSGTIQTVDSDDFEVVNHGNIIFTTGGKFTEKKGSDGLAITSNFKDAAYVTKEAVSDISSSSIQDDGVQGPIAWTIRPTDTHMIVVKPTGTTYSIDDVSTLFAMTQDSKDYINTIFNNNTTNYAIAYQDVTLTAGQTLTTAWNYTSTDYAPYNDGSFLSFVNTSNSNDHTSTIYGLSTEAMVLGATVEGTGNWSTKSFGSTGWQTATFKAGQAGTYRIGYAVFNLDDTSLSPFLALDTEAGTVLKNGANFAPIAVDPNGPLGQAGVVIGAPTTPPSTPPSTQTPTTNSPVEVVVSQIADNVVKNVEQTIVAPQTTNPTVVAGASQVVTPPSVVQVVPSARNEGSATQGGAIVNTGSSTQISLVVAANSNPFASNENISVLSGGVKVASAELPTDVKSDVKPAGIVGAAPASIVVVKQFAPQKGVELALVAPSTNTADSKVAAKVNTEAGSGFGFTVKEAVNVNVAQRDIKEVKATLDNGQALPAWLQFDAKTQTFKAVNPPANALPISTKVSITTKAGQTQQIAVEIAK